MTNRPAKLLKRILAAFIDFFCVFFIFYIGSYICQTSETFAEWFKIEEKYSAINNVVCPSLIEKGLGYNVTSNDSEVLTCKAYSYNEYIEIHLDEYKEINLDKTDDEVKKIIYDDYVKLAEEHDNYLTNNKIYQENWGALVNIDNGIFYVFTFLGEVIFLLIVPLSNKKHKTIGKQLMKLRLVTTKDLEIKQKHVLIKFICLYGVETVLYSVFLGTDTLLFFVPIISLMVILFSPRRQNIHHMISGTMIVDEKDCVVFSSLEEKQKYDSAFKK